MTEFYWGRPKSKGHPDRQIEMDDSYFPKFELVAFKKMWECEKRIREIKDKLNQEIENEFFRILMEKNGTI